MLLTTFRPNLVLALRFPSQHSQCELLGLWRGAPWGHHYFSTGQELAFPSCVCGCCWANTGGGTCQSVSFAANLECVFYIDRPRCAVPIIMNSAALQMLLTDRALVSVGVRSDCKVVLVGLLISTPRAAATRERWGRVSCSPVLWVLAVPVVRNLVFGRRLEAAAR